ncbi:unnamed protein product [Effrenium voratum]|uniref:Uncharacterized protein n=1 Tax=Effrenium voratum TaxID=2562239 RepID=A0AA36IFZ5_9DINO|nr:unnamed protein product [Effrenium voratum]
MVLGAGGLCKCLLPNAEVYWAAERYETYKTGVRTLVHMQMSMQQTYSWLSSPQLFSTPTWHEFPFFRRFHGDVSQVHEVHSLGGIHTSAQGSHGASIRTFIGFRGRSKS